jgi:hypothetical protein
VTAISLSAPGTKTRRTQDAVLALLREHAQQEYGLPIYTRILFYELEALGQAGLIRLVRAEIEARLPKPLDDVLEREQDEREQLRALLTGGSS